MVHESSKTGCRIYLSGLALGLAFFLSIWLSLQNNTLAGFVLYGKRGEDNSKKRKKLFMFRRQGPLFFRNSQSNVMVTIRSRTGRCNCAYPGR